MHGSYDEDSMTQPNDPRKVIVELIDHTSRIARDNDRADLAERLARAKDRITDPQIRVVIAGQLKQGKSQLLNSLLNVPVARVGDDESTVLATVVSYGENPSAKLIVARADGAEPEQIDIPMADLKNDLRRAPQAGGREVLRVEVTAASPLLKGGLAFVDTPGVGGHGQPHLSATLGLLPDADAMLMCSDTSQEFTEPEMTFMRQAFEICPVATFVASQNDM
jgi:replication fork clamp-binding protein CrfC